LENKCWICRRTESEVKDSEYSYHLGRQEGHERDIYIIKMPSSDIDMTPIVPVCIICIYILDLRARLTANQHRQNHH
jgi:hypothetical protein